MKKIGIIIFITALLIGLGLAKVFSFGNGYVGAFNFKFNRGTKGSGNIVSENREIRDFTAVDVGGAIQVEITAQKNFNVEVEADDNLLPLVKTEVEGSTLKIKTEGRYNSRKPILVRISAPNIEALDVSGASRVDLNNINNDNLIVDTSGASKVSINGATKNLIADISGASKISAENLNSIDAAVDSSGASSADIAVSGNLKASASGASKIVYAGTPKIVENKTSGASSVKAK